MPSPQHQAYRKSVLSWFRRHADEPDVVAQLQRHAHAAAVLWELDLEPARPILAACYAPNPRGGKPWDPIVMLRGFLLALLAGQPALNKWIADLAASRVLRVLAGLPDPEADWPGVGTLYDFLNRLHDGQIRGGDGMERPSEAQRRRAGTPRPLQRAEKASEAEKGGRRRRRQRRKDKMAARVPVADPSVTARLVAELRTTEPHANPQDLLERLGAILRVVAVQGSKVRGLLGTGTHLAAAGDGSPLPTGANQYGKRTCHHGRWERCDCPRRFADPDARIGWDHYREKFYFGHHFYEVIANVGGHDLPLAIRLDPANTSDHTASVLTLERLFKALPAMGLSIHDFIADSGHDGEANYRYCLDHGVRPVIPLRGAAPAIHPDLPEVTLSPRGVPTCQAHVEMFPRGTAEANRPIFMCPVKAGKRDRCPLAPDGQPDWVCRPDVKWGPTTTVDANLNPRLCPPVPRNSQTYRRLYKLRSGCERSNSVKKVTFKLEEARHRRASFWLARLHFIAVLQHARAWVADGAAEELVDYLLGRSPLAKYA